MSNLICLMSYKIEIKLHDWNGTVDSVSSDDTLKGVRSRFVRTDVGTARVVFVGRVFEVVVVESFGVLINVVIVVVL